MKQKLIFILTLFFSMISMNVFADDNKPESESVPVDVIIRRNIHTISRSLIPSPEVNYYPNVNLIELTCWDMGEVDVYILDSYGQIVEEDTFNSDFIPTVTMDTPTSSGTYWIVFESQAIYAEGIFIVQ